MLTLYTKTKTSGANRGCEIQRYYTLNYEDGHTSLQSFRCLRTCSLRLQTVSAIPYLQTWFAPGTPILQAERESWSHPQWMFVCGTIQSQHTSFPHLRIHGVSAVPMRVQDGTKSWCLKGKICLKYMKLISIDHALISFQQEDFGMRWRGPGSNVRLEAHC